MIRVDKGSYAAAFEAAPAVVDRRHGRRLTRPRRWTCRRRGGAGSPFALAAAAVAVAVVLGWNIVSRGTASASSRIQVAVLPLARYDTAADVVPEALADAVTDGLIAELARHPAVEVASRTSVMPFRDRRVPLATIATTLSVQAVVEGRVQVTGSRLWVEVRLVDAKRDRKVWVDDFAGDTSDRRELERRVAAALARVLTERFASGVE